MSSTFPPTWEASGGADGDSSVGGGRSGESGAFQRAGSAPSSSLAALRRSPAPLAPLTPNSKPSIRHGYNEQLAGIGLGVTSLLTENLLSHPCVVLRRQGQIHVNAKHYHRTPFTLFPPIYNIYQHQGAGALWKGVTSTVIIQGIGYALENGISTFCDLPRSITSSSTSKQVGKHFLLKGLAIVITTPFYTTALVETVQSSGASDKPGPLEFLSKGLERVMGDLTGRRDASRRLPVWHLLAPSLSYRLSHYVLSGVVHYIALGTVQRHMQRKAATHKRTVFDDFFPDLFAVFASRFMADAVLFPLETVLHRLYCQGTRVLFDNLDNGTEVAAVDTRYEGFVDCIASILRTEGWKGFYKGFGALLLHYSIYYAILRFTKFVFEEIEAMKGEKSSPTLAPLQPSSF